MPNQERSGQRAKLRGEQSKGVQSSGERDVMADALDTAAASVGQAKDHLPEPLDRHADHVADGLGQAAAYVRGHDGAEIADDLWKVARDYPVPVGLLATGIIVGAGYLVARALREEQHDPRPAANRAHTVLSSASQLLGPQTNQTVLRVRDAMVSLALAKMVDAVEHRVPGFREHFDKA
jgi:hypothetical protein